MHVHFVAVAGSGMGSLAGLFKAAGHDVSGSDTAFYPPMGPALRSWGIRLYEGFDPSHLEPRPDLVVVGNVCRPWNAEARAAVDGGLPVTSMVHALVDHMLPGTRPLVVGGTHGKTTTSAMCAWLLDHAGEQPGFLIGGLPKNFDESFRPAATQRPDTPFVVEGDEYDTAFFEKTPKFWHYRPQVAILTSIEHDHIDIYPDEATYRAAFRGFVERVPADGLIVAHAADPLVVEIVTDSAVAEVAWYAITGDEVGAASPDWLATPVPGQEQAQSFDVFRAGSHLGRARLPTPGTHNLRNALGALAATCQGYGLDPLRASRALGCFEGVRRRLDLIGEVAGVHVYDDFAHHPTAVRETLRALRERHRSGQLWAVYEPRSATACRRLHQDDYPGAFEAADWVILAPVGRPDIPRPERLDLNELTQRLAERDIVAECPATLDAIVALLAERARAGDTVALLSNGSFGGIHDQLLDALGKRA